jgi:hypothetical protein
MWYQRARTITVVLVLALLAAVPATAPPAADAAPLSGTALCATSADGQVTCQLTTSFSTVISDASTVTVTLTGNAVFTAVTYLSGCVVPPAVSLTLGAAQFSYFPPVEGCSGPLLFIENLTGISPGTGPVVQTVTQVNPGGLEGPGSLMLVSTDADGSPFLLPPSGSAGPSACNQHDDDDDDHGCCDNQGQHHDDDDDDCGDED